MHISENLPQFEDAPTLIIVCAKQSADVYTAADGELETVAEVRVENPQYSDREGHFKKSTSSGKGHQTVRSGAVYEDKDAVVKSEFYNALTEALDEVKDDPDIQQVILLCASPIKNELRDHLPASIEKNITLEISGNYVGEHPTTILEHIQDAR